MSLILVVEDHPMNLLLVREVLEHRGHEIVEASSVGDAERALAERVPDLVLLDIQIPGGGGEAVLRSIRGRADTAHLPVVAVTAFAMAGDRAKLLAIGFDGYVSKPIDTREFGPTIETFLRSDDR
ncbi:MAG: response regulator [Labilithrix sp.]|nr:response regulator [Labilithrix sp.]